METNLPEFVNGELSVYCSLIKTGKPASCLAIQTRYVDKAIEIIKQYNLNSYKEELSDGWITLWIYKYDYTLEVIKMLPKVPKTVYDHWVLGKLFGYNEESIQEYLSSNFSK